ncbi:MAG: phosphohydrolase [Candidatus Methanomethylicota archaeon]|uniref:Phosphohydrolase n=1 Tax=Thermoproteota archaeon TaxID=2056631 RepID=A0A497EXH2_9CREN|nr:MAG: phosphohydrolase [Candidatus Verstraetearchaeota archaeon]RLE51701.1 MAG: phosphohydrolase [Candidatus Verstraetearchaeota archaeon]
MTLVTPNLIYRHIRSKKLAEGFALLENDAVVQSLLSMSNIMAVSRLKYNDHGPVHSKIVAGSALEIFKVLFNSGISPSLIRDGVGDVEDSKLVTMFSAYLHDIGNAVHRVGHNVHGVVLAEKILDRLLPQLYGDSISKMQKIKCEILHGIFSHDEEVECLTVEAGIAKIADGTDMAEGRARIPYKVGKADIHLYSALAIKKVEIIRGHEKPVKIKVDMTNPAGVFQIEYVLLRKIKTSGLADYVEVVTYHNGAEVRKF